MPFEIVHWQALLVQGYACLTDADLLCIKRFAAVVWRSGVVYNVRIRGAGAGPVQNERELRQNSCGNDIQLKFRPFRY